MRTVIQPQLKFGETDIAAIVIDPKSRDDIPQILRGLQYIYTEVSLRQRVFAILEEVMPARGDTLDLTEWRQSAYHLRCFKKSYRLIQKHKHSTSQDEAQRQAKQAQIEAAYQTYLDQAEITVQRAHATRQRLSQAHGLPTPMLAELDAYLAHAERQIDQIRRRVLQGETISHGEKVFSIFQPHTGWIGKGKVGVPVELNLQMAEQIMKREIGVFKIRLAWPIGLNCAYPGLVR